MQSLPRNLNLKSQMAGRKLAQPKLAPRKQQVRFTVRAQADKKAPEPFVAPEIPEGVPSPMFFGSSGGMMKSAVYEEFYVIYWNSPKLQPFMMPTGATAVMRQGGNLLKLARKEQCLCLTTLLRRKFKIKEVRFWRVFPNGETQYLHPKDGQFPEKIVSREPIRVLQFRNVQLKEPSEVKLQKYESGRMKPTCDFDEPSELTTPML